MNDPSAKPLASNAETKLRQELAPPLSEAGETTLRNAGMLAALVDAQRQISMAENSSEVLLDRVAAIVRNLLASESAVVEVVEGDELVCHAAEGSTGGEPVYRLSAKNSLSGLAVKTRSSLICEDALNDPRVDREACLQSGVRSMLVSPILTSKGVYGVIKALCLTPGCFHAGEIGLLESLAESVGSLIERRENADRLRASEANYRMLFAQNPQPMWVYDPQTLAMLAVNRAAIRHYGFSEKEFLAKSITDLHFPDDVAGFMDKVPAFRAGSKRSWRWSHRKKDNSRIEVEITADDIEFSGKPARLVLSTDVTERVRAQAEATRATRALRMLGDANEALIRANREDRLLENICRIAVETGGFAMAWVGYAERDAEKTIRPVAHAGAEDGYLSVIRLSWDENAPSGNGPGALAIRSRQPVVVPDITSPESGFFWTGEALRRGYRGVVCLPLFHEETTFGMIALCLPEAREIPEQELTILRKLADNLAYGIAALRARDESRKTQEMVVRVAQAVSTGTGESFFQTLNRNMIEALGAVGGLIGKYDPVSDSIETIAFRLRDRERDSLVYQIKDTPCEEMLAGRCRLFPGDLQARFPRDAMLGEIGAEAYAGIPLTAPDGSIAGLMSVFYEKPIQESGFILSTLAIFASRAAAELEKQKADAVLREQASLLDKAQDAIYVRDLQNRLTYWNKGAERIYGWSAEAAAGRDVGDLIRESQPGGGERMRILLKTGEWLGELKVKLANNRELLMQSSWSLVKGADGQPASILCIDTDITEQRSLEQQFLRAQRLESIGTLAGGIAHDLNNLLSPIIMGVGLLKMHEPGDDALAVIDNIEKSARRGADLVKQVLSFARGAAGERVSLRLIHIIREVEMIIRTSFPKNIELTTDIDPDLWMIAGDPTQLTQVLMNLCVNSRDAMPKGGRIRITARNHPLEDDARAEDRTTETGPRVLIEVADNGCGIPRELQERIFEPFFTTKELSRGTGLGLSTALGIIRGHGGTAHVTSEPGGGTVFRISLPANTGDDNQPEPPGVEFNPPRGNGETILLVDDEVPILKVTRETLETFGYRVLTARDGAEALVIFKQYRERIDLVLTDMMMPVLDGTGLIEALRKLAPRMKIIASSGMTSGVPRGEDQPRIEHFLNKPYTANLMLGLIHKVLIKNDYYQI